MNNSPFLNMGFWAYATETDNKDGNKLMRDGSHVFQLPDSIVMYDVVRLA